MRSLTPHSEPEAARVSYSGPPYLAVTPRLSTSTSRLQATAHAKQVPRLTRMLSRIVWPLMARACSNEPSRKLRVGRIPEASSAITALAEPSWWKRSLARS